MKIAISTASSYSDSIKLALNSVGEEAEILNSWGERKGLNKITSNPIEYKALLLQWPEALLNSKERNLLDANIIIDVGSKIKEISAKGIKIIFTFHNLLPHEHISSHEKIFYEELLSNSHIILHHSEIGLDRAKKMYPLINSKNNIAFRHPPYYFLTKYVANNKFISSLNLDKEKRYFLAIGSIAPYKNIDLFLETLESLNPFDFGLIIAGKSYNSYLEILSVKMKYLLQKKYDIKVIDKWLSDSEISSLVKISSFLICNNDNSQLTSGIPHLCESGNCILYSDLANDYLCEISKDYLIKKKDLLDMSKQSGLIKKLKDINNKNNKLIVGERMKEIISP